MRTRDGPSSRSKCGRATAPKSGEGDGGRRTIENGYENHVSIDKKNRFAPRWGTTSAARHEGHEPKSLLEITNDYKTVRTGHRPTGD